MNGVRELIGRILDFYRMNVETEKSKRNMQRTIKTAGIAMACISLGMSGINIMNHRTLMAYTTGFLFVFFVVLTLSAFFFYNEKVIKRAVALCLGTLFSYYTIIGGNNGFALLWTILVPFAYMAIFDLEYGLLLGVYFQVFLTLCFWSPLRGYLLYQYPEDTLDRFPVLYFCALVMATIISVKEKKLRIAEIQSAEKLQKAVCAEQHRVERLSIDAISSIVHALDAKDQYTRQHSENVAYYSERIALAYGMSDEKVGRLKRAARLHDLGKIGISDVILNKQSGLTEEEYSIMKSHAAVGAEILSDFTTMPELMVGAKYHHERFDGKGYPQGLLGADIPLEGRIIAVADSLDAMYSSRVYRDKTSKEYVREELRKGSGTQFDPQVITIAIDLIDQGMLEQLENVDRKQANA